MKGSRWPHTVIVEQGPLDTIRLVCSGCRWETEPLKSPTISRLTLLAQDHRRAMQERA